MASEPLGLELFLDYILRGYAGVVGSRHPEDLVTFHASPPAQDVLEGVVQGVADVKASRHIRRWDDNAVRWFAGAGASMKKVVLLPIAIPPVTRGGLIVTGRKFHRFLLSFLP